MLYCAWLKVKSSKSKFKVKDKVQSSHSLIHLSTYILHLTSYIYTYTYTYTYAND